MRGLTCFLPFLLGLLLLSFVHTALQVLHDVQQLFRGLRENIQSSMAHGNVSVVSADGVPRLAV